MKRKNSIKKIIMQQFVFYSIAILLVLMSAERLLELVLPQALTSVALTGLMIVVYMIGVILFGYSIGRKIVAPVQEIERGFRTISNGDLNISLDFETVTEFGNMRDSFNDMANRLKVSEEERQLFEHERMQLFSNIAHDLKTPLTTISGYAGALASGMVEEPDKQMEYYSAIKVKSEQVNLLLDQLLAYSKMGTRQYQPDISNADITELIRASCASLFGEIEKRQIELELVLPDTPVYGNLDILEMNRAVTNLLTNAIVHNPEGGMLLVRVGVTQSDIIIEIADNGPAIPEEITKSLFEPFVSGDYSRRTGSGTGLGLAIVKKIAGLHGGNISIQEADAPYRKKFVFCIPII